MTPAANATALDETRPTLVWRRGDAFVAYEGELVGVRWTGVPGSEQLRALADAQAAASAWGHDVLLVNDVLRVTGSTRVEPRVQAEMRRLIERARSSTRAVAHVIEVPGPIGGFVRAFLNALEQVAGAGRTSTRAFARPEEAAAWLSGLGGGAPSAAQLVSRWRAMIDAAAPGGENERATRTTRTVRRPPDDLRAASSPVGVILGG